MRFSATMAFAFLALGQFFCGTASGQAQQDRQPASYWQINFGFNQSAYTYSLTLESKEPDKTTARIYELAIAEGISPSPQQQRGFGRKAGEGNISLSTTPEKAEAFCQKAVTAARLKQFHSYSSVNETALRETRKKRDTIKKELDDNSRIFEKLPIARAIMEDLLSKYEGVISGYETSLGRADISITIVPVQQQ